MKRTVLILTALACILTACTGKQDNIRMLIGTLTPEDGSPDMFLYEFNQNDATYKLLDSEQVGNPTYILPFPDKGLAFSVVEFNDGRQGVSSLALTNSSIEVKSTQSTDGEFSGADPCNILVSDNSYVLTTNYSGGSVSFFPMADGIIKPISKQFRPADDPVTGQPHMHCAMPSPDGRYIFINDLGLDCIWRFDAEAPADETLAYQFSHDGHPGPRHLIFNAAGDRAYVLGELGDMLSVFSYSNGELTHMQTVKAYDGDGKGSADLHLTPNGKFLYTSHRLKEDGISIFRIQADGTVERTGYQRTGIHPRNFTITPNGKYLLCALRDSNRVEIYEIDPESGSLTNTGKTIELHKPMFVRAY